MEFKVRRVEYFYTTVRDQVGEGYELLSLLAEAGVNLVAFTAVPIGPLHTQLTVFPDDPGKLVQEAKDVGFAIDGPHPALMVQGDDKLGALANVHRQLAEAGVSVYASSGAADGRGSFGYVIYVRPEEFERAVAALGL
jgi:hypothetical protein